MILYADTSSLFKLYLVEAGSAEMRAAVFAATQVTSSKVAYAETRVALARAFREGLLGAVELRAARQKFDDEWPSLGAADVSDAILREAGDLGDLYPIRGFDAIHLASAKHIRSLAGHEVVFSTADNRLHDAAIAEGFSAEP